MSKPLDRATEWLNGLADRLEGRSARIRALAAIKIELREKASAAAIRSLQRRSPTKEEIMSYRPEIVETLASAIADLEGYIDPANRPDGYRDDALFLLSKLEEASFEVAPCRRVVLPDKTITISSGVDHPKAVYTPEPPKENK